MCDPVVLAILDVEADLCCNVYLIWALRCFHFLPQNTRIPICGLLDIVHFCVSLSVRVCSTGHVRHCDKQTSRRQEQCFAPARIEPQIQGEDGGWDGVFDQTRVGGL